MRYPGALAALTISAGVVLAGCADQDDPNTADQSEATQQAFNDADVAFAQQMIPHHQQAVQMADMAEGAGAGPEVQQLADDIAAAQGPEIATMTGWLESWDEDVPEDMSGMDGMDHGDMDTEDMPGMMSTEEMDQLEGVSGAEFDQMFLTMMIAHHEGAIEMAQTEQAGGEYAEAVALAKKIEADQTAEIDLMQGLLNN